MQHPLDILQKVQQSEAPPFLFTRIETKLEEEQAMKLTPKFAMAIGTLLLLVLGINYMVINNSQEGQNTQAIGYSETSLSPEYNTYYK
jgi:hypothetical protein